MALEPIGERQLMAKTIHLQFLEGLTNLLGEVAGVQSAHLHRSQPVGENETQQGAVIVLYEELTKANTDNQFSLPLTVTVRITVYQDVSDITISPQSASDDLWQAINGVMYGACRQLPGVQGVTMLQREPDAESDARRLDLFYNVNIRVSQLDLTQAVS